MKNEEIVDFNIYADNYDCTRKISDEMLNVFLIELKKLLPDDSNFKNVLEIGCGTGRISKILALNGFSVTGVEISEKMLDIALRKAEIDKWDFRGINADARNLPFSDDKFDFTFSVHVLHLIKDWKKVIEEILRCTRTKLFVNASVQRFRHDAEPLEQYWRCIQRQIDESEQNNIKIRKDTIIGAVDEDIIEHMKEKGYKHKIISKEREIEIGKEELITLFADRNSSSQRFLTDEMHEKAQKYLVEKNYFLDEKSNTLKTSEHISITIFTKE
ncbi:MAG: class I SAM-dependent methyltransferase [Candidatus Hodarchaeales archaeon]|jgi:ubiquinone/menaquinone biosynthesis C-methylase UbiE